MKPAKCIWVIERNGKPIEYWYPNQGEDPLEVFNSKKKARTSCKEYQNQACGENPRHPPVYEVVPYVRKRTV
jgi:hypothetical protein